MFFSRYVKTEQNSDAMLIWKEAADGDGKNKAAYPQGWCAAEIFYTASGGLLVSKGYLYKNINKSAFCAGNLAKESWAVVLIDLDSVYQHNLTADAVFKWLGISLTELGLYRLVRVDLSSF